MSYPQLNPLPPSSSPALGPSSPALPPPPSPSYPPPPHSQKKGRRKGNTKRTQQQQNPCYKCALQSTSQAYINMSRGGAEHRQARWIKEKIRTSWTGSSTQYITLQFTPSLRLCTVGNRKYPDPSPPPQPLPPLHPSSPPSSLLPSLCMASAFPTNAGCHV